MQGNDAAHSGCQAPPSLLSSRRRAKLKSTSLHQPQRHPHTHTLSSRRLACNVTYTFRETRRQENEDHTPVTACEAINPESQVLSRLRFPSSRVIASERPREPREGRERERSQGSRRLDAKYFVRLATRTTVTRDWHFYFATKASQRERESERG